MSSNLHCAGSWLPHSSISSHFSDVLKVNASPSSLSSCHETPAVAASNPKRWSRRVQLLLSPVERSIMQWQSKLQILGLAWQCPVYAWNFKSFCIQKRQQNKVTVFFTSQQVGEKPSRAARQWPHRAGPNLSARWSPPRLGAPLRPPGPGRVWSWKNVVLHAVDINRNNWYPRFMNLDQLGGFHFTKYRYPIKKLDCKAFQWSMDASRSRGKTCLKSKCHQKACV